MFTLPLQIMLYFKCLTIVPQTHTVLTIREFLSRCSWFFANILWTSFFLLQFTKMRTSITFSFLISFFISNISSFSVYIQSFVLQKPYRKDRLTILRDTYIFPLVPVLVLSIISFALLPISGAIAAIALFIFTDIVLRIVEIIAGELVSFGSTNSNRLADGLGQKGLVKYWAYSDFLLASMDQCDQRRESIFHSSGELFTSILSAIKTDFDKYSDQIYNLFDDVDPSYHSYTRINDGTLSVSENRKMIKSVQANLDQEAKDRERFGPQQSYQNRIQENSPFNRLLKALKIYETHRKIRTTYNMYKRRVRRMTRQNAAIQNSYIIIEAARALQALIDVAPKEDEFGIIQSKIELIIKELTAVILVVPKGGYIDWSIPTFEHVVRRYSDQPIAKSATELTELVRENVEYLLDSFVMKYGKTLDFSQFPSDIKDEIKAIMAKYN